MLCLWLAVFTFQFSYSSYVFGQLDLAPPAQRYSVKSGIVIYELGGNQSGRTTVYFDRWGLREAKYTQSTFTLRGQTVESNTFTLLEGKWIYSIDLDRKSGIKFENAILKQFLALPASQLSENPVETFLKLTGAQKMGRDSVNDYECEIWETQELGTSLCTWKGIPIKSTMEIGGSQTVMTMTSIETEISIAEDKFSIPPGTEIINSQDIEQMAEMFLES